MNQYEEVGRLRLLSRVGDLLDVRYLRWGSRQIAGHEFAGILEHGTAVAVEGFFGCGRCEQCEQSPPMAAICFCECALRSWGGV